MQAIIVGYGLAGSVFHAPLLQSAGFEISAIVVRDPFAAPRPSFEDMIAQWIPVTLILNSMNRSLGQPDAYPFALSAGALRKLRYVHEIVQRPHPLVANPPTVLSTPGATAY